MIFSLIMEQVLTRVCKLQPTPEQASKIDALLKAFADACNAGQSNGKIWNNQQNHDSELGLSTVTKTVWIKRQSSS
ncbi:hypothetical protein [Microcoleus sp. OTE_8_concoct_300]|uniref:hypothetical protein n=1 Tax=Microcoleus sp. OTE_8_concoct_300 TaxID=2964710 RepID=UPI00403F5B55